jgi:predicted NUDIX family phosphoesterase
LQLYITKEGGEKMGKMDEVIIVVPRKDIFAGEVFTFQGVEQNMDRVALITGLISSLYTTMRRGDAEEDVSFKQPIPYCIIRRHGEVFLYRRLSGGGETRLHDKLSIGVGGHMNDIPQLKSFEAILQENLERELEEELEILTTTRNFTTIGLINDDKDQVGKVHIGLLVILDIDVDATVNVRETDQLEGQWVPIHHLDDIFFKLESWSQIAAKVLV